MTLSLFTPEKNSLISLRGGQELKFKAPPPHETFNAVSLTPG